MGLSVRHQKGKKSIADDIKSFPELFLEQFNVMLRTISSRSSVSWMSAVSPILTRQQNEANSTRPFIVLSTSNNEENESISGSRAPFIICISALASTARLQVENLIIIVGGGTLLVDS